MRSARDPRPDPHDRASCTTSSRELVTQVAPQLLAERGVGVLIAAKLIGEIAGIDRFKTDAKLARLAACAPIPVHSGRTDRHRLDPGGNRQLNHAIHMLALTKIIHDPEPRSTSPDTAAAARPAARRSAASNDTSSAASTTFCTTRAPSRSPSTPPHEHPKLQRDGACLREDVARRHQCRGTPRQTTPLDIGESAAPLPGTRGRSQPWQRHSEAGAAARVEAVVPRPARARLDGAIATARQVCWAADSEQAQSRLAWARAVPRDR